jgi:hypothetical protein
VTGGVRGGEGKGKMTLRLGGDDSEEEDPKKARGFRYWGREKGPTRVMRIANYPMRFDGSATRPRCHVRRLTTRNF